MWATLRRWGKDERRGVFQAFNLAILGTALIIHAVSGLVTRDLIYLMMIALPGTVSGAWIGGCTDD
jgi:hypothetical protein